MSLEGKSMDSSMAKKCNKCLVIKDNFSKDKTHKDGLRSICKDCQKVSARENYLKTKDKRREYQRAKRLQSPEEFRKIRRGYHSREGKRERYRDLYLRRNYKDEGIYKKMYAEQRGLCKICYTKKEILFVDHNHTTQKVRGLLCRTCNTGIGMLKDDCEIIERARIYVEEGNK